MLYLFRARLNEAYIANVSFAKSARNFQISVAQSFIFLKKCLVTLHFQSRKGQSPIFWGQGKICFLFQSTLCGFFAFAELNHFSDCMVSVQSGKYLS